MLAPGFKNGPTYPWIEKDENALLDYTFDWNASAANGGPWLQTGETIQGAATWTVPAGITLDHQTDGATTSTAWLAGGTAGTSYLVTCDITTSSGRTDERSFLVAVIQR